VVACGRQVGWLRTTPFVIYSQCLFDELSEGRSIFCPGRKTGAGTPAATVDGQVIGYRDAVIPPYSPKLNLGG
jgi:hypothetical protein